MRLLNLIAMINDCNIVIIYMLHFMAMITMFLLHFFMLYSMMINNGFNITIPSQLFLLHFMAKIND